MATSLTIVRNPASDAAFERAIAALVDEGIRDPDVFQARLAERYPLVLVRPRELDGESLGTWYVYRDGHWIHAE